MVPDAAEVLRGTIWNGLRLAPAVFSGRIIFKRAMPERPRKLRHCIFTGGGVKVDGICSAAFCESAALLQTFRLNCKVTGFARGSPFEERLPPLRGKMSPQVTKGGIWHRVAMTERVLPLQKRNTGTPAGVPVPRSLNKENQIRLRASSSPTRMKSGCSCRMLAGTSGVTGPKRAFLTISALPAPLTTISTLRACMMVRMPMV